MCLHFLSHSKVTQSHTEAPVLSSRTPLPIQMMPFFIHAFCLRTRLPRRPFRGPLHS